MLLKLFNMESLGCSFSIIRKVPKLFVEFKLSLNNLKNYLVLNLRDFSRTASFSDLRDSAMNYYIRLVQWRMFESSHWTRRRRVLIVSNSRFIYLNLFIIRFIYNWSEDNIFRLARIHRYKPGRTICSFYHIRIIAYFVNQNATLYSGWNRMLHDLPFHFLSCCPLGRCSCLLF